MSIIYNNVKIAGVGKNGKDGTGFTLFTPIWQDHLVNNASWLRADTFSWQSGAVYVAAYNHLVADFNGTTSATETIGSTTITYYRATDGHKIVLPDQENNVMSIYNATGIAWYYILDTTNQRFKLPRNKYGFTGFRDGVGNYVAPGLPNITGSFTGFSASTGAILSDTTTSSGTYASGSGTLKPNSFDASRSSDVYGKSDTVQPPAVQTYLYFFVGNTVEEVTTINVGQITESLNGKADISLNNVPTNYDYVVESKLPTTDDPTWYRVYKSGWVEQGGPITIHNDTFVTVTLHVVMLDTNYMITKINISDSSNTGLSVRTFSVSNLTTTTFQTFANATPTGFVWKVEGQGAN